MLFIRLSAPANEPVPLYCGVSRVMSLMRPDTVGRRASSARVTAVDAPVRCEPNVASLVPRTVTCSATAATLRVNSRSVDVPRLTVMASLLWMPKPASSAVTL
jgi:hypothetical protein